MKYLRLHSKSMTDRMKIIIHVKNSNCTIKMSISVLKMALHNIKSYFENCEDFTLKMGQIFCIIPWHRKGTSDLYRPVLNKIFALVYLFITVVGMYWFLMRYDHFYCFNHFDCILSFTSETIGICFTAQVLVFSNFIKLKRWKKLLHLVAQTQIKTPLLRSQLLCIILGLIFFFITRCYYHWFKMDHLEWFVMIYVPYEVALHYYFLLSSLIICLYVKTIQNGFKQAVDLLKTYSKSHLTDIELEEKIRCIGKNCRYLFKIGENNNDIFGWTVLLIFSNGIVQVLRTTNLLLFLLQGSHLTLGRVFIFYCKTVLCFGESIYIIISCEASSRASGKIRLVCHKLQENVHIKSSAREEFFKLATVVTTFSPKLTAANFFIINRGTLLGIVNLSTTYLLVILQFYMRENMEANNHDIKK